MKFERNRSYRYPFASLGLRLQLAGESSIRPLTADLKGTILCSRYSVCQPPSTVTKGGLTKNIRTYLHSAPASLWIEGCFEWHFLYLFELSKSWQSLTIVLSGCQTAQIRFYLYVPIFDSVDLKLRHPLRSLWWKGLCDLWLSSVTTFYLDFFTKWNVWLYSNSNIVCSLVIHVRFQMYGLF